MSLGSRFPPSGVILPGRLSGEREHRDVRRVADFLFGIAAEETDESDSVEVHTFLLFCPFVSGTRKRVGAAPKTRSYFSGGPGTGGARTGTVPEAKERTGNGPETVTKWLAPASRT